MRTRQNKAYTSKLKKCDRNLKDKKFIQNGALSKKNKSAKFIQRSKQMEEYHRKQKIYEEKYCKQTLQTIGEINDESNQVKHNEDVEDPFDGLLCTLVEKRSLQMQESSRINISTNEIAKCKFKLQNCEKNLDGSCDIIDKQLNFKIEGEHDFNDTFAQHFDYELTPEFVEILLVKSQVQKLKFNLPNMGKLYLEIPLENNLKSQPDADMRNTTTRTLRLFRSSNIGSTLKEMGVKPVLVANVSQQIKPLQSELFGIMNDYRDLYYPHCSQNESGKNDCRSIYCLHALNHMLKTRSRITNHNGKMASKKDAFIVSDNYRDQGLVRPKVLIILPFRDSAFRVVNTMIQLLYGNISEAYKANGPIINYDRFHEEYTGDTISFSKTNPKPEDYEKTFSGNTEDNFRIGISLTKKCLKLYTDFYASDILIASPLGLRLVIGSTGNSGRDYDFLNSIELLIIDQAELLLAQNWENLLHVLDHLHLQPQSLRDADIRRVRTWCIGGLSRFYRQTVLLSSHELPEFRALFNSKCFNYQGKVRVSNAVMVGDMRNIILSIPQVYRRVNVTNMTTTFDERFQYFVHEVLPRFRNASMAHCMLYVPSYFDYVRLRNYFKEESISFVQICEYTKKEKIARARDIFFHSGAHFMLYSERSHFFRRTCIKGIRHLIMYQPPVWPHFYSEMINMMHDSNQNRRDGLEASMSVTVIYTKYDFLQLSAALGTETATKLIKSSKVVHAYATE